MTSSNTKLILLSWLLITFAFCIALIIAYTFFYSPIASKTEQIRNLSTNTVVENNLINDLIAQYNAEDGYQKIRLTDKGGIEYYAVKMKPIEPLIIDLPTLDVDAPVEPNTAAPVDKTVEDVNLYNNYAKEISPDIYKDIDFIVNNTSNREFISAVKFAMKDGKITYGEYQELSKPMVLLSQQVEIEIAKNKLANKLK